MIAFLLARTCSWNSLGLVTYCVTKVADFTDLPHPASFNSLKALVHHHLSLISSLWEESALISPPQPNRIFSPPFWQTCCALTHRGVSISGLRVSFMWQDSFCHTHLFQVRKIHKMRLWTGAEKSADSCAEAGNDSTLDFWSVEYIQDFTDSFNQIVYLLV